MLDHGQSSFDDLQSTFLRLVAPGENFASLGRREKNVSVRKWKVITTHNKVSRFFQYFPNTLFAFCLMSLNTFTYNVEPTLDHKWVTQFLNLATYNLKRSITHTHKIYWKLSLFFSCFFFQNVYYFINLKIENDNKIWDDEKRNRCVL